MKQPTSETATAGARPPIGRCDAWIDRAYGKDAPWSVWCDARVGQAKVKSSGRRRSGLKRNWRAGQHSAAEARTPDADADALGVCASVLGCLGCNQSIVTRVKHQQRHQHQRLMKWMGRSVWLCAGSIQSTAQRPPLPPSRHSSIIIPCIHKETNTITTHSLHHAPPTQVTGRGEGEGVGGAAGTSTQQAAQVSPTTSSPSQPAPFS